MLYILDFFYVPEIVDCTVEVMRIVSCVHHHVLIHTFIIRILSAIQTECPLLWQIIVNRQTEGTISTRTTLSRLRTHRLQH